MPTPLSARALQALLGSWRGGTAPAYGALADRIRLLVLDGRIAVDTRLAAERDLANRLGLSRTTVSAAYRTLRDDGYLLSVRGSGSVTRMPAGGPTLVAVPAGGILDFSKATLPAIEGLAEAAQDAADRLPAYLAGPGFDPVGLPELREAIAERYRVRGLPTDPDQIMVTLGAQHAIALVARTLLSRGDRALIEAPTYPHAYDALRQAGARLVSVPVTAAADDDRAAGGSSAARGDRAATGDVGWDEAALLQAISRTSPVLGYLMPDFHNPTGQSMPNALRERAVAAAERQGTILVTDETTAELNIDRVGNYRPLASFGDVVTIGSVGKTMWGGIRLGWIRADRGLIRKFVSARTAGDLGTPLLEQLVVTQLIGDMPAILDHRRRQLAAGRAHLADAVRGRFPEWTVPSFDGGLAAWINLGIPVSSQLAMAARGRGLLITAGPRFGIDGAFERFLRIPIGNPLAEIDRAIDALTPAWQSLLRHPSAIIDDLADVV